MNLSRHNLVVICPIVVSLAAPSPPPAPGRKRRWFFWLKVLATVGTIGGALIGVLTYRRNTPDPGVSTVRAAVPMHVRKPLRHAHHGDRAKTREEMGATPKPAGRSHQSIAVPDAVRELPRSLGEPKCPCLACLLI
jgi:hypothetical protein